MPEHRSKHALRHAGPSLLVVGLEFRFVGKKFFVGKKNRTVLHFFFELLRGLLLRLVHIPLGTDQFAVWLPIRGFVLRQQLLLPKCSLIRAAEDPEYVLPPPVMSYLKSLET